MERGEGQLISRKLFVDTLVGIKKEFENRDSAEKELAKLGLRIDADRTPFLESMLEILKEVVPDPYDYIGWWLYDASDYRVSWEEDGQKIEKDLQNPNDLYDFLLDGAVKSTDVETLLADVPAKEYDLAPQKMIEQTDFLRYMGKLPIPVGYYLMLKPGGQSFLGGGLFADLFKDATQMVRDHISAHGDQWNEIVTAPAFQAHFTVGGTRLKNVPAGYDPAHPQAEYLKHKSWYLEYPIPDADLLDSTAFLSHAAEIFRLMKPFNDYLNAALARFKMPER